MPNFNGVWSLTTQIQYAADWPVPLGDVGLIFGNAEGTKLASIDRINIASSGSTFDFGDMSAAKGNMAALGSATRGVIGGGNRLSAQRN